MYTRSQLGTELKERVARKQPIVEIGRLAYEIYLTHIEEEEGFVHILLTLNAMEDGPEFALSYKRLGEIADALIVGCDVSLDY